MLRKFLGEWALAWFRAWNYPLLVWTGMESPPISDPTFDLWNEWCIIHRFTQRREDGTCEDCEEEAIVED